LASKWKFQGTRCDEFVVSAQQRLKPFGDLIGVSPAATRRDRKTTLASSRHSEGVSTKISQDFP